MEDDDVNEHEARIIKNGLDSYKDKVKRNICNCRDW